MRKLFLFFVATFFFGISSVSAALPGQINLRHDYQLYPFSVKNPALWAKFDKYFYKDTEVLLSDEERAKLPSDMLIKQEVKGVNRGLLQEVLEKDIAPKIFKKAIAGRIEKKDGKPSIVPPLWGEELDIPVSIKLIEYALKNKIDTVDLAVKRIEPDITIDQEYKDKGITEILSVGESDFTTSSDDRIHNIKTAIAHFQGQIIEPGAEFSFVKILGTVDDTTGYRKELVIKQDSTVPEWGGGICQVSSTLYRGVMLAGLPVAERANHSYAVSYYYPYGSDATIYPGSHDLRFVNNTKKAIMLTVFMKEHKLFFVILGTPEAKEEKVAIFGPYITSPVPAPPARYVPSTKLPPQQTLLISPAHNGLTSTWFRSTAWGLEKYVSVYEARPKVYKVGGLTEVQIGELSF